MPAIGAKRLIFAPIQGVEPENALPTYDTSKVVRARGLVSANMTITTAEGQFFGDDAELENVREVMGADLATEVGDFTEQDEAILYGSTYDEATGEVIDSTADNPPRGGLAYYKTMMKSGVKFYRAYFYPLAQAALGNDNAATKTGSITFQTAQTGFKIFVPNVGKWRNRARFDSEADAIAYCDQKMGIQPNAMLASLKIGALPLTPEFDESVTAYTASTTNGTNTITATPISAASTVEIKVGDTVVSNGSAATWADGENIVTVKVTNGDVTMTYTVTVTKTA